MSEHGGVMGRRFGDVNIHLARFTRGTSIQSVFQLTQLPQRG